MGRYIDDILQPGEKVLYSTNAHWIFYVPAIAAWIVAIFLFLLSRLTATEGLVPSLDHRDRRHQYARCPQDRLHQAPHVRDEPRQGRERRRQPEHSWSHIQLRRRHGAGRRRGGRDHRYHRFATRVPQSHHRAIGAARNPWPCKKILAVISPPPRRPRSTPARSLNSQNCRTNGGIRTARWRRCTRSTRCA